MTRSGDVGQGKVMARSSAIILLGSIIAIASLVIAAARPERSRALVTTKPVPLVLDPRPVEPLSAGVLRRRSVEVFPNTYATLLSIVLGIALAQLAASVAFRVEDLGVFDQSRGFENTTAIASLAAQASATLMAVIVVYYNYVWFLLLFRWTPGVWDTIIPTLLGLANIWLSASVGNAPMWLVAMAAIQVVAIVAFRHTMRRAKIWMFSDSTDWSATSTLLKTFVAVMAIGGAMATVSAWTARAYPNFGELVTVLVGALLLVTGWWMLSRAQRTMNEIYARHDVGETSTGGWGKA